MELPLKVKGQECRATLLLGTLFVLCGCGETIDPIFQNAEGAVRATLRDPDSAKFSDLQHCGKSGGVSGTVNAKNGFGGYSGATGFVYVGGEVALEIGDVSSYLRLMPICSKATQAETKSILATIPK